MECGSPFHHQASSPVLSPPPLPFDIFYRCCEYLEVFNSLFCFFTVFVFMPSLILLNTFSTGCVSIKYHTIPCKRTLRKNLSPQHLCQTVTSSNSCAIWWTWRPHILLLHRRLRHATATVVSHHQTQRLAHRKRLS